MPIRHRVKQLAGAASKAFIQHGSRLRTRPRGSQKPRGPVAPSSDSMPMTGAVVRVIIGDTVGSAGANAIELWTHAHAPHTNTGHGSRRYDCHSHQGELKSCRWRQQHLRPGWKRRRADRWRGSCDCSCGDAHGAPTRLSIFARDLQRYRLNCPDCRKTDCRKGGHVRTVGKGVATFYYSCCTVGLLTLVVLQLPLFGT